MSRPKRLTPEIMDRIAGYLSQGGYIQVAAQAAGVPRRTFAAWMRRGRKSTRGVYRKLYDRVCQAKATARLRAEINVYQKYPKLWLCHGPGREQPGSQGWSTAVKASPKSPADSSFSVTEWHELLTIILQALMPFPEARQAVIEALEKSPITKGAEHHDNSVGKPSET